MTHDLDRGGMPRAMLALLVMGGMLPWRLYRPHQRTGKTKGRGQGPEKARRKSQAKAEKKAEAKPQPKTRKEGRGKGQPQPSLKQTPTIRPSSRNRSRRCRKKSPR